MIKDPKFLQQAVISMVAIIVTALFLMGSYRYEESFLSSSGVNVAIAREVAEIDMRTYLGLFESLVIVSTAAALFSVVILRTKLRDLLKRNFVAFLLVTILLLLLFALKFWLYPILGINGNHPLYVLVEPLIAVVGITMITLNVINIIDIPFLKKLSFKPQNRMISVVFIIFAVYWLSYGFSQSIGYLASVKAIFEQPQEKLVLRDKEYRVIRTYSTKILLSEEPTGWPKNILVWYPESEDLIRYKNDN